MKTYYLVIWVLLLFCWNMTGFGLDLAIETSAAGDQSNNIRNYLTRAAEEITHNSLAGITSLAKWQVRREKTYEEFLEMMSLVDVPVRGKRPPLNVTITGTIQQKGFRIVKLYYESLPHLYVPANLYIPDNLQRPAPAILYVCGHSRTQKVHYQAYPRKFARLGFVCLIIETIQFGEVRGVHWGCYNHGWFQWYSRGYTPGGVELWNGIRGLDLLCARPEVDKQKLGVTGISGGGAYSWYIAAADERIKAAAPVCGTSTIASHIFQRTIDGHCDCMVPINTYLRDTQNMGALIAPRPLMIASAERDGLNVIEAVRRVYHDVQGIYKLYGKPDNIVLVETPGGHSYHKISRTRIFSFFLHHLAGKDVSPEQAGDIDESPEDQLSEDELRVYVNGPPADDRTPLIQDSFIKTASFPRIDTEAECTAQRNKVVKFLTEKTFGAFCRYPPALDVRWEFRTLDGAPYGRSIYSYVPEKGWRLKMDVRRRQSPEKPAPMMVVLRSAGENRGDAERFISGLDKKWNITYLDVRGIGETSWNPSLQWHIRRASAWTGRTIASMRVYDVLRCLAVLRHFSWVDRDRLALAGRGEMAAVVLYAALLDGNIRAVILKDPPATQNAPSSKDGRGEAIEMLNCLRITDLPQVAALLYPCEMIIFKPMPNTYLPAKKLYRTLGREDAFHIVKQISDWR